MACPDSNIQNYFIPAKCPFRGKDIMISKELTEVFCSFCGKHFLSEAAMQYAAASTLYGKSAQPEIRISTEKTPSVYAAHDDNQAGR